MSTTSAHRPWIGHFRPFMADYSRLWPLSEQKTPLSARFWLLSTRLLPFPAHTIAPSTRPFRREETAPATPSRPRSAPSPPSFADGGPPHGSRGRGFADYEHRKPARTSPPSSCPYRSGAHGAPPRRAGP